MTETERIGHTPLQRLLGIFYLDDLADPRGGFLDLAHGLHRVAHHLAARLGIVARGGHHLMRVGSPLRRAADRSGDLVEGGRRLLKAGGLVLGAPRKIVGRLADLARARADAAGRAEDAAHRLAPA